MIRRRRLLSALGPALAVVIFLAGCGSSDDSAGGGGPESDTSGERVSVGNTEAIVWGEGDRAAVLSHGAAYDAASWESQGQALEENGVVALAV
ncbi:MAG: hypothetical protein QOI57_3227, partial [Rubrobacteraceae bacterium]|nr:hypothetical protein [Rubrobacteraceae bacterium]